MGDKTKHIGGKRLLTRSQALAAARKRMKDDYPGEKGFPFWDLIPMPEEYKSKGIFIMGEPGSGKTVYLQDLIAEAMKARVAKAVIHDFKMDLHPFLERHLNIQREDIKMMHPFDERCCGWDIQKDIEDEDNAGGFASALIPDPPPQSDPFWTNKARDIATAAVLFFFYKAEDKSSYHWQLRDLIDVFEDADTLKEIINNDRRLHFAKDAINRDNNDVLGTVTAHSEQLKTIANIWAHPSKELISLREWRTREKREILILGSDDKKGEACPTLNRLLWKQLYREVIAQDVPALFDVWFFFDEFYWMSRLEDIEAVATVARARRANLVLATQDINQVREVYGESKLNILIQGCSTQVYFRCDGDAADWAAKQIGKQKRLKQSSDQRVSGGTVSIGKGEQEAIENVVMSEDIEQLRKCTSHRPMLDAIIKTFIDNPFHYPMEFESFRHVWPSPKIDPDYRPEKRREVTKRRPLSDEERDALEIPRVREKEQPKKRRISIDLETGRDMRGGDDDLGLVIHKRP